MGKEKQLSDEELMTLATVEFVELVKQYRDGDLDAIKKAKYPDILKERGLQFCYSKDLVHRIFMGEFDNIDGIEAKVTAIAN